LLNLFANLTTDGLSTAIEALSRGRANAAKALDDAVKVTAFNAKNLLQKEIKRGIVGGQRVKELSHIAKRLGGRSATRSPLAGATAGVKYSVRKANPFTMAVGFIPEKSGGWVNMAEKHQKGFDREITPGLRKIIINRGGKLGTVEGGSSPFFLKRSTKRFKTPARPLVSPFWEHHHAQFERDIIKNFKAKLAGERI